MSLNAAFGNALSGLAATARMAEVVSANLANALTDGYARRTVELSAASVGGRGAGVRVDAVARQLDLPLLAERRGAGAQAEARRTLLSGLAALEGALGAAEAGSTLSARLAALEESLVSLSADPSSETRAGRVLDRLGQVAGTLRGSADEVARQRAAADADIARRVEGLNADLRAVDRLNRDIVAARALGTDATGLLDQRQAAIDRIATVVPLREMDRDGGAVALFTPQGTALLDGEAATVGFMPRPVVTAAMSLAGGTLSGLAVNGQAMAPPPAGDGVGRLSGGSLGAAFALRDGTLAEAGNRLDALARDLIQRFEEPAADPTRTAGAPGLLTDAGSALAATPLPGLASRIAVSAAVDPGQGGALWRLREGSGAAAPGPAGDAAQVGRWIDALSAPRAPAWGGRPGGASALAAAVEAEAGADRLAAEEEAGFAAARLSALEEAEGAEGVDSDQEMQILLRVEQAYAANARVIQALDAMTRALLEI